MTNLRTDEIVFFRNLTKIGTDENKAIYSIVIRKCPYALQVVLKSKTYLS